MLIRSDSISITKTSGPLVCVAVIIRSLKDLKMWCVTYFAGPSEISIKNILWTPRLCSPLYIICLLSGYEPPLFPFPLFRYTWFTSAVWFFFLSWDISSTFPGYSWVVAKLLVLLNPWLTILELWLKPLYELRSLSW